MERGGGGEWRVGEECFVGGGGGGVGVLVCHGACACVVIEMREMKREMILKFYARITG